jgi:hypothetical protein
MANAQASKPVGSSIDDESRNRAGFSSFSFYFVSQFLLGDREKFVVGISPTDGRQACFPNDERAIFTMPLITDAKKKIKK